MTGDPRFDGERGWATRELEEHDAGPTEAALVMRLLEVWWEDGLVAGDDPWRALGMFETLARGKALERPSQAEYRWEQARPGGLVVRDYVRVRLDAYPTGTGQMHNGRSGPIVAIRSGDIHVKYDDGIIPAFDMPVRHSPHALEKRFQL